MSTIAILAVTIFFLAIPQLPTSAVTPDVTRLTYAGLTLCILIINLVSPE